MSKSCVEVVGVQCVLVICVNGVKRVSKSSVEVIGVYGVLMVCVNCVIDVSENGVMNVCVDGVVSHVHYIDGVDKMVCFEIGVDNVGNVGFVDEIGVVTSV